MAANRAKPKRYEIVDAATAEATVYLYDVIDPYFGVSAKQFVKDLNAITASVIHLRINSPGGDVFDGRAIATAISQHKAKVIAHIDGLAASAASYVAIAADEVEMSPGSFLMIHKAWTMAFGNAEDLLATASILEKIDATLVEDYAKATGATADQIAEWMAAETWFTADEAVSEGFADRVTEESSPSNKWDLSVYDHAAPKAEQSIEKAMAEKNQELIAQISAYADEQAEAEHAERIRWADFLLKVA